MIWQTGMNESHKNKWENNYNNTDEVDYKNGKNWEEWEIGESYLTEDLSNPTMSFMEWKIMFLTWKEGGREGSEWGWGGGEERWIKHGV